MAFSLRQHLHHQNSSFVNQNLSFCFQRKIIVSIEDLKHLHHPLQNPLLFSIKPAKNHHSQCEISMFQHQSLQHNVLLISQATHHCDHRGRAPDHRVHRPVHLRRLPTARPAATLQPIRNTPRYQKPWSGSRCTHAAARCSAAIRSTCSCCGHKRQMIHVVAGHEAILHQELQLLQ